MLMTNGRLVFCASLLAACSSSTTTGASGGDSGPAVGIDAGGKDTGATKETGTTVHTDGAAPAKDGGPVATTTIAAARQNPPTGSITVEGYVTALAGVPKDYPQWYIEDPNGGQYSGVVVYCDPLVTKACTVPEPALHDLILVTGTIVTYKGQIELEPSAMTLVQHDATPPPVPMLTATDLAPTGNSSYRGVYVALTIASPTKLVVDSVTPSALADTACGATFDAGTPSCTNACEPPLYAGFQANDGTGNEVYVEAPFFSTDPLQSSPECLTQPGVAAVKVGQTFSAMAGILDIDPYAGMQALSPVQPSDYATP